MTESSWAAGPPPGGAGAPAEGWEEVQPAPPDPDAPHQGQGITYIPALDGLRAFAVLSVMAYHGGLPFMSGGFLGVDTFFVLSGFLITTLLLGEWGRTAAIKLGAFWARRARRLLPCLLMVLLFVAAYAAFIVPRGSYPGLRLDALSTLFYVANWHFILVGSNYFAQTGPVSPLTHTWSLAIEEQFYLVWPLVVLGVLKFAKDLRVLLGVCVVGALASAAEMALLYSPTGNVTRLYYGTDTHAQCLLVGAGLSVTLALVAKYRRQRGTVPSGRALARQAPGGDPGWAAGTATARLVLTVVGLVGVVVTGLMWWRITFLSSVLWRGGFLVAALATAAVLVSAVCAQRSPVAVALSVSPLRYLGRISYGMYLWHFPLFLWIDHARTGLTLYPLFALRLAVTVGVATASFFLVERPIRQGSFFREWRAWAVTPVAALLVVVALIAATEVPAVATVAPSTTKVPPSLLSGPPVRMLLLGDSTALTLGIGLDDPPVAKQYNLVENDQGILGCGVTEGSQVQLLGQDSPTAYPCNPSIPNPPPVPAGQPSYAYEPYTQQWQMWLDTFKPNVVVLLAGRWETVNRTYNGQWTDILDPTFAAYVKSQLQASVNQLTSTGAHLVLMTAPCYDEGEQPNGEPWPEDSPARLAVYNQLVTEVAAANPTKVTLVNLNAIACPGGKYEEFMGGVQVRQSDGVHFTIAGGEYLAPQLLPTIVAVGRKQMAQTGSG